MVKTLCLTLFCITLAVSITAQDFTIPLHADSQPGTPAVLYGSLTASQDLFTNPNCPCAAHLSIANTSSKAIVLLATELLVDIGTDDLIQERYDQIGIDDYFLEPDLFQPNSTKVAQPKITSYEQPKSRAETASQRPTLRSSARVVFVQFADGSTWGDLNAVAVALRERVDTWNELLSLANTYRSQGEEEFLVRLKEPSAFRPYLASLTSTPPSLDHVNALVGQLDILLHRGKLRLHSMGESLTPASP